MSEHAAIDTSLLLAQGGGNSLSPGQSMYSLLLNEHYRGQVMEGISAQEDEQGNYNYRDISNLGMVYLYIHRRDRRRKPNTKKEYARELLFLLRYPAQLGKSDIRELTRLDMEKFQQSLELKKYRTTTRSKKIVIIQSFLTWCYEEGYLTKPIARGLQPVHLNRTELPDRDIEEQTLRDAIDYYKEHPKVQALLLILATSGLRLNEIITPVWGDLYYDAARKRYYLRTKTKRDKLRHAHIKDYALAALLEYRRRLGMTTIISPTDPTPFYPNRQGLCYTLSSLSASLSKWMAEAGLTTIHGHRITPHYLRHYFTQTAYAKGAPLDWISETLDHSSTKITKENYLSRVMKKERDVSDYVDLL